jgi:hypothetical protein
MVPRSGLPTIWVAMVCGGLMLTLAASARNVPRIGYENSPTVQGNLRRADIPLSLRLQALPATPTKAQHLQPGPAC